MPAIEINDTNRFTLYTPRSDTIKAVKLTVSNVRTIAAHVLKTIGGTVQVDDTSGLGRLTAGPPSPVDGRPVGFEFSVGDWMVEEYNYEAEEISFRTATLEERQKYDLR